jgi:hypothetical protein
MAYFAAFNWGWLLGALLIGLGMGWISIVQHGNGLSRKTAQRVAVLIVILIGVAVARLVPGRFGYWLDLGLLMLAAYLVGCAIGSWLRDRFILRQAPQV